MEGQQQDLGPASVAKGESENQILSLKLTHINPNHNSDISFSPSLRVSFKYA